MTGIEQGARGRFVYGVPAPCYDLDAHEVIILPFAGLGRGIGVRDLARGHKHQGDCMFGCGGGIAERRIHHDDALCGRRRDIDMVDANAGATDDSELRRLFENLGCNLCR
jgi:hypothetical protein